MVIRNHMLVRFVEQKIKNQMKKHDTAKIVIPVIVIIVVGVIISIIAQTVLKNNAMLAYANGNIDSTWLGSVASYWGGIIGGIISGTLACTGVVFTIRYYKESDADKERKSVRPFLLVREYTEYVPPKEGVYFIDKDYKNKDSVRIRIKNIGNGFAHIYSVCYGFDYEESYRRIYELGEDGDLSLVIDKEWLTEPIISAVKFHDSMGNAYIQEYVWYDRGGRESSITNSDPELIKEKTSRSIDFKIEKKNTTERETKSD